MKYKRLGDIVNFKRGYDLPSYNRIDGPYPIISSSGKSGCHNEYKAEGEGIIIGRYGTLGRPHYINGKYWPHNTALYVTNFKGNYPKYIYYLLSCLGNLQTADKSTVPGINRNDLHEINIPYIDNYQKEIADALWKLDSKIELNNKINTELEAMAKLIYDYWFVQFDFPISKEQAVLMGKPDLEGKPYKSSGGKMVYNEQLKREIPEGWEVKELGDLGSFKNGVNYNPSNPGKIACPIINVRNISASSYFLKNEDLDTVYLRESDVKKYSVHDGSIIIARSGIPGATRLISDITENTLYCGFAIHYQLEDLSQKIPVFFFLKSIEQAINQGSGGTILKNVNQGTLNALKIVLPETGNNLLKRFNDKIQPMFDKINLIQKENQKLSELRDWLLPMLMNGQVTIKDAVHYVNEHTVSMAAEGKEGYGE
ncbi:restriction endonuclease subunit S [Fulvivirga sp. 29W222]|uniref:Restriction endonuclease subunit S n=1 Tax=Fulvivirga marina TaxID=2494733 RepID=A0A937KD97_9BACT|nr:restriction endonuclease subunit S [Fulvivirga marina]MBL6448382.1 restriction endonuclease subunit S [Fulvivirga marina]